MSDHNSPHDNIDVRVNNKINIYGNVTLIGSISVAGVGFLFLTIWITNHWTAAITLSAILVYSFCALLGLSALGLVAALWVKLVIHPSAGAYERVVEAKGQDIRNKFIHAQDNGIVHVDDKGELKVVPLVTLQQRDIIHHKQGLLPPPAEEEEEKLLSLPEFVNYEEVRTLVPLGHTLLGLGSNGHIESRPFRILDTLWIVGGSKTGKTNTAALKVEEGFRVGRRFIVIDPHRGKEDCLSFAISGFSKAFLRPVAQTKEEIREALTLFKQEAERRMNGGEWSEEWTLIVDEVGALTGRPGARTDFQEEMYRLISPFAYLCGWQLRGFGMSGWFISQTAIGLAWLRETAMTVIVHKLLQENQQKVATNSNREIMRSMPDWPRGRVFVYGLDLQGEYLLQQPIVNSPPVTEPLPKTSNIPEIFDNGNISGIHGNNGEQPTETLYADFPPAFPIPETQDSEHKNVTAEERERIVRLAKVKVQRHDICFALGKGKGYYGVVKQVLDEEGL